MTVVSARDTEGILPLLLDLQRGWRREIRTGHPNENNNTVVIPIIVFPVFVPFPAYQESSMGPE